MAVVLDASAVLALLWREPGHEIVSANLEDAIVSAVNVAEVYAKCVDRGVNTEAMRSLFSALTIKTEGFGEVQAFIAGELRRTTREFGLSLGDRACLATAIVTKRRVITADRIWRDIKLDLDIISIR